MNLNRFLCIAIFLILLPRMAVAQDRVFRTSVPFKGDRSAAILHAVEILAGHGYTVVRAFPDVGAMSAEKQRGRSVDVHITTVHMVCSADSIHLTIIESGTFSTGQPFYFDIEQEEVDRVMTAITTYVANIPGKQ